MILNEYFIAVAASSATSSSSMDTITQSSIKKSFSSSSAFQPPLHSSTKHSPPTLFSPGQNLFPRTSAGKYLSNNSKSEIDKFNFNRIYRNKSLNNSFAILRLPRIAIFFPAHLCIGFSHCRWKSQQPEKFR